MRAAALAVALAAAATSAAAQKPASQRCAPTLRDDQAAALGALQRVERLIAEADPDGSFGPQAGDLGRFGWTQSGNPELDPLSWRAPEGSEDIVILLPWAADAHPALTAADDPCGFIASKLLCDALPGDLCECSCSVVQPADGFGGLAKRHGCPAPAASGGDEPPLSAAWTTFACPQMSWTGHIGDYLVQPGGVPLPGSGTDLPIAVLGGTIADCAQTCSRDINCDVATFGYDQESESTFCLLKCVPDEYINGGGGGPPPEVVQVVDFIHAVWELQWAVDGTGADAPVDQRFVDTHVWPRPQGQQPPACYQERLCWTSVCLDQEAVAVRAFGSLSLPNASSTDCATAIAAPEGYRINWRLNSMSRPAHTNAGRLELYDSVSPHATPTRVIKVKNGCSETGPACSETGRSTGPVFHVVQRASTSGETSWKLSWRFVPDSEPGCTSCVPGCMLTNATNFDPAATVDDRSCSFDGLACGDWAAANYDPASDDPYPGQCAYTCDGLVSNYITGVHAVADSEVHCFDSGPERMDEWKSSLLSSTRLGVTPSTGKDGFASATSIDVLVLDDSDWMSEEESTNVYGHVDISGSVIIQGTAQSSPIVVQIVASGPMTVLRWITFTTRPDQQYTGYNDRYAMALSLFRPFETAVTMAAMITRCSFVGLSSSGQGGAILAAEGSVVHIDHSSFVRCHALSGGALLAEDAQVWVRNSVFETNYAETSLVSRSDGISGTGGAILARASTILSSAQTHFSLEACAFRNNGVILDNTVDIAIVRGGWTAKFDYLAPRTWWIRDSYFSSGNHNPIFSVFLTASGTLSCTQHPCPLGYGCSVSESSLQCQACASSQHSGDGILCHSCGAGKEASTDATACQQCPAGLYSDGVSALRCSRCPEGQRANNQSTACVVPRCGEGEYSTEHDQCVCPFDAYNSSHGSVQCIDADDYHVEPMLLPARLHCQPCPTCLTCSRAGSFPKIAPGWSLPTRSASLEWTVDGPSRTVRLYSCPHDEDNTEGDDYTCGTQLVNATSTVCSTGYDGALCGTCASGYTRKNRDCISCPAAKEALHDRYTRVILPIFVLSLIGICCLTGTKAKWLAQFTRSNNVGDLINCISSSMHIVISMAQITSQFSAVLDFSFKENTPAVDEIHKTLGHMLLDLKVLVELGCWGFTEEDTFYWKWLADVVIIPGFLCGLLLLVYACGCASRVVSTSRARSRSTSSGGSSDLSRMTSTLSDGLQSELEVVQTRTTGAVGWVYAGIFFTLPRMTTTAFNAFRCRNIGGDGAAAPCEKWLEAAYAVDCCSDRYDLLVLGGVLGAAAILAFPLGFAVVLTQETRKNWKKFEHAQAEATHGSQSQEDFSLGGGQEGALRRSPSPVSKFPTTVSSRGSDDTGEDGGYQLNLTLDFFDDLWLFSDKSQFYEFNYKQLDEHFNFFVYCYHPRAYYWEVVEVLYKIVMSGFLMFAPGGRGSVGQLFCGLVISFLMVSLTIRVWPYNNDADNWLRFAAEVQIFQTIAVALALKSRGSTHSALDALDTASMDSGYDWLMVITFWVLTPMMLIIVLCWKLAAIQKARQEENAVFERAWRASGHSADGLGGAGAGMASDSSAGVFEMSEMRTVS